MTDYFVITGSLSRPCGAIYRGEPPKLIGKAQDRRLSSGDQIVYGPMPIPAALEGQPIDVLMAIIRGEKPKLVKVMQ